MGFFCYQCSNRRNFTKPNYLGGISGRTSFTSYSFIIKKSRTLHSTSSANIFLQLLYFRFLQQLLQQFPFFLYLIQLQLLQDHFWISFKFGHFAIRINISISSVSPVLFLAETEIKGTLLLVLQKISVLFQVVPLKLPH